MVVFEEQGSFVPNMLQALLRAGGVTVLGVTNTDTAVQIICQDGTPQGLVDEVVAAYPNLVMPSDPAAQNLIAAVSAVVTAPDFAGAQTNLKKLVPASALNLVAA